MPRTVHRMPGVLPGGNLYHREKPKRNYGAWGITLLIIGMVSAGYWFLFLSPYFAVTDVEITGTHNPSVLAVSDRLRGANIFSINQDSVEQSLREAYPSVASATLIRGLPHVVRLTITLRDPALRWYVGDKAYITDANGQVFSEGDKPEYAILPKVVDQSGEAVSIGQQIVPPSFIRFVNEVDTQIPHLFHRSITTMEITETTYQVDVVLDSGLRLRLTTQRPSNEQLQAAAQIFAAHPDAKVVDVRVTGRGYWK